MNVSSAASDDVTKGRRKGEASYLNSSGDFKVECPTRKNLTQNYRDFKRTLLSGSELDEQHGESIRIPCGKPME